MRFKGVVKKVFGVVFLLLLAGQPCVASPNYDVCFNALDVDVNGTMTKGEFLVAFPNGELGLFDEIDTNADRAVDREEWMTYIVEHGKKSAD
ncbi:hypothetical protein GO013_13705 [Pseudodesulfovibrio sp. JC047]|uniref:EF-hand domain-containing protein n=1 Tax=Pseudodesulfovibrio sp. JC047 TaxID=2683199 RepID=UPI0013D2356E|nr:EF-hand domain-containing protein [Pseudodesulfovibrio sp. JC047]NDV20466.1 hypothetical protein [Pseudodesulfovibrio sp. JC047]